LRWQSVSHAFGSWNTTQRTSMRCSLGGCAYGSQQASPPLYAQYFGRDHLVGAIRGSRSSSALAAASDPAFRTRIDWTVKHTLTAVLIGFCDLLRVATGAFRRHKGDRPRRRSRALLAKLMTVGKTHQSWRASKFLPSTDLAFLSVVLGCISPWACIVAIVGSHDV